jgi:hypothetical protein
MARLDGKVAVITDAARVEFVGRNLVTPEFKADERTPTELKANLLSPEDADEFPRERSPTAAPFSVGSSSRDTGGSNPPCSASQAAQPMVSRESQPRRRHGKPANRFPFRLVGDAIGLLV